MFIEPTITWVPSGFSGYIWLDTKIVLKKKKKKKSNTIFVRFSLHTVRFHCWLQLRDFLLSSYSYSIFLLQNFTISIFMTSFIFCTSVIFCTLSSHFLYFEQSFFVLWAIIFCTLSSHILHFEQSFFVLWTNIFCTLNSHFLYFIHFQKTVDSWLTCLEQLMQYNGT